MVPLWSLTPALVFRRRRSRLPFSFHKKITLLKNTIAAAAMALCCASNDEDKTEGNPIILIYVGHISQRL
jgi:hypothetical protein